jgi:ABC-type Fe3+-hydroxamate transport system substrate-binding protein
MSAPRRIVSLVPSVTETLFELGVGDRVVGITDFCIFPAGLDLPRLGGTKNPDIARVRELAPDVVYMNREENLKRHADAIAEFAPVVTTEPKTIDDVVDLIRALGERHEAANRASALIDEIESERSAMPRNEFSFLVPIWKKPWMWCGGDTYVSSLVQAAGGQNLLGHQRRYPEMDLECALALQPDVIFLPDEPFSFTAADAAAIEGPRVVGPFSGHLFTWHGARTREGLRFLRSVIR